MKERDGRPATVLVAHRGWGEKRNPVFGCGCSMKFPINISNQKRCPVCKKLGPGTKSAVTPRPEAASLSFRVMSFVQGRSYPVFLGSLLQVGWDSGVSRHPQSRTSIGASFLVAKKGGRTPDVGTMEVEFCSTRCMRKFLKAAVDELDRRIVIAKREVRLAKKHRPRKPAKSLP